MSVATVVHHRRGQSQDDLTQEQEEDEDLAEKLDKDGDGSVDVDEMKAALKARAVSVRMEILQPRLTLEKELTIMCSKLPNFLICVATLLMALLEFSPAADVSNVHRHLNTHFQLDDLTDSGERVVDMPGVYAYMLNFAKKNEELQASSVKFWCEDKYATYYWDVHLLVPRWSCRSPRQYALTLSTDKDWSWSVVNSSEGADQHAGEHRRLGGTAGQAPACKDQDELLQQEEGDDTLMCSNFTQVCEIDIGILLCPVTCGYCAPWEYQHTHRFDKPQVTMLPVVIYQTRFALAKECHGFATTYQAQPYNPALWKLPPLDGEKRGDLLTCVDRSRPMDDDYALEVKCPESAHCEGGVKKVTHKRAFHGDTVYPKMLVEPVHDMHQLEAVQWLDAQTDIATVSTMVYTEDMEVFTSLSVDFTMDGAGNVNPSYSMVSYRDMLHGSKTTFVVGLVCTACGAMVGAMLSLWHLYHNRKQCKLGLVMYELLSRLALVVFPIFLLMSWSQQLPMAVEYDHLLHTFLDLPSTSKSDMEDAYQKYFDVKTHIYGETSWLKRMKITAYIVLYMQFVQLILYMSAHPKMGVLTETISKAFTHLLHFFFLFGLIFCSLGFVSHWMLGEYLKEFATFGKTMESQARMMFGEFIYADGAHHLSPGYTAMYWVYAGTYMLIIFFIMLNFFLAIIVDAFVDVKEQMEDEAAPMILNSLATDVFKTLQANIRWRLGKWPPRSAFLEVLDVAIAEMTESSWVRQLASEDADEEDEAKPKLTISIERLLGEVPGLDEEKLAQFLHFYFSLSPHVLCKRSKRPKSKENPARAASKASNGRGKVPTALPPGDDAADMFEDN